MATRFTVREAIEAEVERVRSLGLDELRTLWRTTFRSSSPPRAFNKEFLVRTICWHIQERALGGHTPEVTKLLNGFGRSDKPAVDRFLKAGTVLVREYQGERHTVTVVPDGYVWRETTYASLSTIARAITGTAWSGPRFFGIRGTTPTDVTAPARVDRRHMDTAAERGRAARRPKEARP
jgi:Protein of unknown function (DUF2924)